MKTKLALEILLWHPTGRPYDVYDVDVIKHFWIKLGNKWNQKWSDETGQKAGSRLSDMHAKMRDLALTHLANLIDSICSNAK